MKMRFFIIAVVLALAAGVAWQQNLPTDSRTESGLLMAAQLATSAPGAKPSSAPSTKPASAPASKPASMSAYKPSSKPASVPSSKPSSTPSSKPAAPQIVSVEFSSGKTTLSKGQSRNFSVTAVYSNGARKDITGDTSFRSSDIAVVTVSADGRATAKNFGQAVITAGYLRHWAAVRLIVPQPLDKPFPAFPANNKIDEFTLAKFKELGIVPSELCSDTEFLRRVYLDTIGLLPTPQEAETFLADTDPAKRAKLIDKLLERDEFADFWAMKWGDLLRIKSEYPVNLWPNAAQAYHHWVRDSIAKSKPYDQFVREMLTATGSDFRNPPANYYRDSSRRDPQSMAESTALVFMGVRMECARCHAHPAENWTTDDNLGMAAFFSQVQFKITQEWKEEIVSIDCEKVLRHPTTKKPVPPKFLDGPLATLRKEQDGRAVFAEWLTSPGNPWFTRCIVNRVWYWLEGRGIVHEPDDFRSTNPPGNPELLDYLAAELVGHKYDLKHIYRLILNSRTYQLSAKTNPQNAFDTTNFSHYMVRRLTAEQLLDAIGQITETSEGFTSRTPEPYTIMPEGFRAIQLPDGSIGTPFLELFGRPSRDTSYESERDSRTTMRQALHLLNSTHIENKLSRSPRLQRMLKSGASDSQIVDEIYLAMLSRPPVDAEKTKALEYIGKDKNARLQAVQDLVWAIMNTKEFLFNH